MASGSLLKLIQESGGELTQEVLILFLNFAKNYSYKIRQSEILNGLFAGQLQLRLVEANLPSNGQVCVEFQVMNIASLRTRLAGPAGSASSDNNNNAISDNNNVKLNRYVWSPERGTVPLVDIRNKDKTTITMEIKILDNTSGQLLGFTRIGGSTLGVPKFNFDTKQTIVLTNIGKDKDENSNAPVPSATLTVEYEFIPWWKAEQRGFVYSPHLPVLSPDVELPIAAEPNHAFVVQDTMMKEAMGAIMYYWKTFGGDSAMSVIPQRLSARIDWANTDEFFVNRRMNGFNPQFWERVPDPRNKNEYLPNRYQINWDFNYLKDEDINVGALWFRYIRALFSVVEHPQGTGGEGLRLIVTEIQWQERHTNIEYSARPGEELWEKAKTYYKYVEVNLVYNWTHVGVHFDVEQYAMAVFRNLTPDNPLYTFLVPHFDNIVYNDREVIRPTPDGAVTIAGALTYSGQMKMVIERFKGLTFKWNRPPKVLPDGIIDNVFDKVSDTFWNVFEDYVHNWIMSQKDTLMKDQFKQEIEGMARDLQAHALNKDAMGIDMNNLIPDLQKMCVYCIYQAIFYHDWVHWNSWDDFHQSLFFTEDCGIPADQQAYRIDVSNRTQAFITYTSPTLRQWPILDPLFGGKPELKTALKKNAKVLNRQLLLGTYILAPNT